MNGEETIFVYNASGQLVAEYTNQTPQNAPKVSYLTSDHLGSPRITTDVDGKVYTRRDFMPFGEEIDVDDTSQRSAGLNYAVDEIKQKFTSYERDNETELDFAQARMYANKLGRFTSVDPALSSGMPNQPQSWNRYNYTLNNPLLYVDPTGLIWGYKDSDGKRQFQWFDGKEVGEGFTAYTKNWYIGSQNALNLDPNSANWYEVRRSDFFSNEEWESFDITLNTFNIKLDSVQEQRLRAGGIDELLNRPEVKQTLKLLEIAGNITGALEAAELTAKGAAKSILANKHKPTAVAAAVDVTTGESFIGMSGGNQPTTIHSIMQGRINLLNSTGGSRTGWCITNCAEFRAVNNALLNGSQLNNLQVHTVKRTSALPAFSRCPNCQVTTSGTTVTSDH